MNVTSPGTNFFISLHVDKWNTSTTLPESLIHYTAPYQQKKGIRIQSNVAISVLLTVESYYSKSWGDGVFFDSGRLLPVSVLSQEYVVQVDSSRNIFMVGVEANTAFNITFTDSKESHMISGILSEFDTYLLNNVSINDVGGCIISSSKPIAVFSSSFDTGGFFFEQILPDYSWGYKYILPDVVKDIGTLHFRIFASIESTNVHTYLNSKRFTLNLNRGTYIQSTQTSGPIVLYANKPIMVMLYGPYYNYFLTTIPAISQFSNTCSFYVPKNSPSTSDKVIIFIKNDDLAGLIFKGRSFPELKETQFTMVDGLTYAILTFELHLTGSYYITHTSAAARFGGFVFGTNDRLPHSQDKRHYTYGYPLDMVLNNTKPGILCKVDSMMSHAPLLIPDRLLTFTEHISDSIRYSCCTVREQ